MGTYGTSIGQKLVRLKGEIEREKEKRAELQGSLKTSMSRLTKEFEVKNLEEAKKMVSKIEKEVTELQKQIQEGIEEIENLMDEGEEDYD